jgi:hypothetical protein
MQFQSVGIKDKLNTRALQLAQLTPPSQLVGARSRGDARSRQRRRYAIEFWIFLLPHKIDEKLCSALFSFHRFHQD